MKEFLKNRPLIGTIVTTISRTSLVQRIRGAKSTPAYQFERLSLDQHLDVDGRVTAQMLNLLNYSKTSMSAYNAQRYPAGYHTIEFKGSRILGQRDPRKRLGAVPYDFGGKIVLDIGCNQGGMLFEISDRICHGVGIDYDSRLVNAANKIRSHRGITNLDFYVFDLDREDHQLICDFLPGARVDIVFLLSVCMWIRSWRRVVDFASSISGSLLFEANGTKAQQDEQVSYLGRRYRGVRTVYDTSHDDPGQKHRCLYFCS